MPNIKLYIGNELADFNEVFNVVFSIGDIRDIGFGSNNKTYTLNLPLTKTNRKLLSFISQPDVKTELSSTGRLYLGDLLIISGKIVITDYSDYSAKIIITSDDWMDVRNNVKLSALDLSAYDHLLTHAVVEDSWASAYPFYRYPMINFGALASAETGSSAKWNPNDFIPMFSISQIITKILSPYTISSAWLASNFIKDLFIIAKETIATDDFINNKDLDVSVEALTDNNGTVVLPPLASGSATCDKVLLFLIETLDQANAWINDTYTIPVTGTYRFTATLIFRNTAFGNGFLTITDELLVLRILQTRGAVVTTLYTFTSAAYTGTELIDSITYTLETKYCHFIAGDTVTVDVLVYCQATNSTGSGDETVHVGTKTTSRLINVWNNVCKYPGLNKNISAEEMLPDMTQLEFLAAVRDIFNLRFWLDKNKQVVYIEPGDSFLSSFVVDLTNYVDFESISTELISQNYYKYITFKFKDDSSDKAYEEFLKTATSPGKKEITLNSIFTKPGSEIRESYFSSVITGYNHTIVLYTVNTPRIWAEIIDVPPTVFNRLANFNARIVEWKGLTAGFTWYYETETKTTYPKIQGLDYNDATNPIYANYLMKTFHYIDKGKLFTIRMKIKPGFLTEFLTVIKTATEEAFRPTYKITISGDDHYFFLQKVTSDGYIAELKLVLKV